MKELNRRGFEVRLSALIKSMRETIEEKSSNEIEWWSIVCAKGTDCDHCIIEKECSQTYGVMCQETMKRFLEGKI